MWSALSSNVLDAGSNPAISTNGPYRYFRYGLFCFLLLNWYSEIYQRYICGCAMPKKSIPLTDHYCMKDRGVSQFCKFTGIERKGHHHSCPKFPRRRLTAAKRLLAAFLLQNRDLNFFPQCFGIVMQRRKPNILRMVFNS